jgi:hypothetical protein
MELINTTWAAAHLQIGQASAPGRRLGVLAAKATFHILPDGRCEPDREDPFPLYKSDEETPLGLLPRDDCPKESNLDVIVLGHAYAPGNSAAKRVDVSLRIGGIERSLAIFGDRIWEGERISDPAAFDKMPLIYANAFGGKCEVEIDRNAFITLADPRNPEGKGFRAEPMIPSLIHQYRPPEGFPRFEDDARLPNIEEPQRLITSRQDAPDPACWAAVPLSTSIQGFRAMSISPEEVNDPDLLKRKPNIGPTPAVFHRAHPSLDLDMNLPPGAPVALTGLTPEGPLEFALPSVEMFADVLLGDKTAEARLRPDTLVLLPDERRLYIVSRLNFTYEFAPGLERSVRLRITRLTS